MSDTAANNYTIINADEHNIDDVYEIRGTATHVFPFAIQANQENKFIIYQLKRGMQDGALRMWISKVPLDQQLFVTNNAFNPIFLLKNWAREIIFWDENTVSVPNGTLTLIANQTYFINIKNAQASDNSYRLIFPKL